MNRLLLCLACVIPSPPAQNSVSALLEAKLYEKIRAFDNSQSGVLGVAAIDLATGRILAYHADTPFPTASSIKIPIMIRMFRDEQAGRIRFSDKQTLSGKDNVGGSEGPLQAALDKGPVTLTVLELLENMIRYSDNSATNRCIDLVGMDRVNALLREFGLTSTHLRRKMMDVAAAANGRENVSTPMELTRLVRLIYEEKAAGAESCHRMLAIMKKVDAYMRPAIPKDIEVASKPGDLDGVKYEAGLVLLPNRPFVLTVMSAYDGGKENPVGPVTELVFGYFNKLAHSNELGRRLN